MVLTVLAVAIFIGPAVIYVVWNSRKWTRFNLPAMRSSTVSDSSSHSPSPQRMQCAKGLQGASVHDSDSDVVGRLRLFRRSMSGGTRSRTRWGSCCAKGVDKRRALAMRGLHASFPKLLARLDVTRLLTGPTRASSGTLTLSFALLLHTLTSLLRLMNGQY